MADITAGTYQSGPGSGRVLIKTGRAGVAARAGHDLTIEVTRWSAEVTVPGEGAAVPGEAAAPGEKAAGVAARGEGAAVPDEAAAGAGETASAGAGGGLEAATVSAELDLGSLAVREGTGGAKPLTGRDRAEIEKTARKILGSASTASFSSTRIIPASGGGAIEGTLTLGGRSRPVRLQVVAPAQGKYRGSATIRQTEFGITPYSGFFGTLKLRDEVAVEFEVTLGPPHP